MESTNTANPSESLAQKAGHVSTSILITEKTLTVPGSPAPKQKYPFLRPRKLIFFSLLGVGAIALAIFVYRWWHYAQTHQETENAYISGHVVPVTTRISGTVMQVLVDDNQNITQGSLLLKTAMDALAREELGIHIDELYESPCSAAMTLFYLCRSRAIIPFSIYFLSTGRLIGNVSILASRLVRFIIATGLRCEAKRSILYSETRQRVFSIVEAASTFGDRRLIWTTQTRMVGEFS